ncbi:hypothetical protein TTHMIC_00038 [Tetrahymena thermophila SB210]|uniref:Uncharacterized protein n=1 Tax=Tetrahymena thermophila (strain SB210) TaxID=312017 RepID=A0A1B9C2D1_TETTS|nr:hypothetical protein TTHMIC_00038 [Tetrahymena thermophila SB210]
MKVGKEEKERKDQQENNQASKSVNVDPSNENVLGRFAGSGGLQKMLDKQQQVAFQKRLKRYILSKGGGLSQEQKKQDEYQQGPVNNIGDESCDIDQFQHQNNMLLNQQKMLENQQQKQDYWQANKEEQQKMQQQMQDYWQANNEKLQKMLENQQQKHDYWQVNNIKLQNLLKNQQKMIKNKQQRQDYLQANKDYWQANKERLQKMLENQQQKQDYWQQIKKNNKKCSNKCKIIGIIIINLKMYLISPNINKID